MPLYLGEIVKDELIQVTGMSVTEVVKRLGVSHTALSRLLNGHVGISSEMSFLLRF